MKWKLLCILMMYMVVLAGCGTAPHRRYVPPEEEYIVDDQIYIAENGIYGNDKE